jgi:hypothetical protein
VRIVNSVLTGLMLLSANALAGVMTYVGEVAPGRDVELINPNNSFVETATQGRFLLDGFSLEAYCIEPTQSSVFPNEYSSVVLATTDLKYKLANSLYSQFYTSERLTPVGTSAIQAVLWEIWVDTTNLNFETGNFRLGGATDAAVALRAQQMLTASIQNNFAPKWTFTQLLSPASQDLLTATPSAATVSVPGALSVLSLGLLVLGCQCKSNSKRSSTC